MSNTIDSKVVEMRFDNKHFEQNVNTSLSTIDKLKQKLNFKNAGKSLEGLNNSVKKVDMSQLGNSVEKVGLKFDAMYTMADQALRNITNSAMMAGKKIVSALTIDPIKTGFQEYETQLNATQSILSNVKFKGKDINDVNAALDELNKYADQTIYNFTEMTKNIGYFTNAGVDLDVSVSAIKGFSNAAAIAGADSTKTSMAMYQLSQAMSTGVVKLMDWRSLTTANIGGQKMQESLKETARVHGIAIDSMIEKNGSFNDSLKEDWLTAEIMNETLEKYTATTEGLTDAEVELLRAKWKSRGYTEEQIDGIIELGNEATEAATKVKSFTQMWDVLKETAQSGWAQTWRLIFGDLEQAKAIFTPLTTFFQGIIDRTSEARNNLLKGALDSPLGQLAEKIANVTAPVTEATDKLKDFSEVVNNIIRGDYGNGQTRFDKLSEEGYNWMHIQNLVNEKLGDSFRYATDYAEAQGAVTEAVLELTDAQLKEIGLTDEEIKMYRDLEEQAKKSGKSVNELIAEMDKMDGRTMLIESFKNAGKGLVKICTAIRDAWRDAFPPMTSTQLYNIIAAIHEFSKKLAMSDETADKLTRTLKGVFAILDIITTLIGTPIKLALKLIGALLGNVNLDILSVTATIGDLIVAFRNFLFENNIIIKGLTKLGELIRAAVKAFLELDIVQDVIKKIKDGFSGMVSAGQDLINGLIEGLQNGTLSIGEAMINIGKTILNTIKDFLGIHSPSTKMIEIGKNIIDGLVEGIFKGIDAILTIIKTIGSKIVGFFKSIDIQPALDFIKNGFSKLVEFFKGIDWGRIIGIASLVGVFLVIKKLANVLETLAGPLDALSDIGEGVGKVLKSTSKAIKSFSHKMNAEALKSLAVAIAILVGSLVVLVGVMKDNNVWEAVGVIATLAAILTVLSIAVGNFSKGGAVNTAAIAVVLLSLGASMLMMSNVIKQMDGLSPEGIGQGILVVGGLMIFMALFTKFIAQSGGAIKAAGTILAISISIGLLVGLMALIQFLPEGAIEKGLIVIGGLMTFLAAFIIGISMYGGQAVKVGATLLGISISIGILVGVIALIGLLSPETIEKGAIVIGGLMIFLGLFVAGLSPFAGKIAKVGATLLALSVALLVLVGVIALIGLLEPETIAKGMVCIWLFMELIAGFIRNISKHGKDAPKVAATLLALSVSIGILAMVTAMLGIIPKDVLGKGVLAVTVLGLIMTAMIKATKDAKNCKANLIVMTVAIGVMAAAVIALSMIPFDKLAPAVGAMAILMGMFALMEKMAGRAKKSAPALLVLTLSVGILAGLIYILAQLPSGAAIEASVALSLLVGVLSGCMFLLGKVGKNASKALASVIVLTALAVPLVAFVGILALMQGVDIAISNVIALSLFVAAMSAIIGILGKVGKNASKALASVIVLTALAVPLVAFVGILALMQGVKNALPNVIALSVLVGALTLALLPLTIVGSLIGSALLGVVGLLALAVPLVAFVGILALMQDVKNALPNVIALSLLVGALTLALLPLTLVGSLIVSALLGVVGLLALAVPLLAFVGILKLMDGLDNAMANTLILTTLMGGLSKLMVVLAICGPMALIGTTALWSLMGLIGVFGVVVTAVGALMEKFPQLESFIDTGIPIMEKLANGLGSMLGNFVEGFATAVVSGLPEIGTQLSMFMLNATPFIVGAKMIDEDVVAGVKSLANCFITLAGGNLLESLTSWLTGESSVEAFGKQLPALAGYLKDFASELGTFDESTVATVTCAANALKALADASKDIPNSGGLLGKILGENDAGDFGAQLPLLGAGIAGFALAAQTIDDSKKESINCACECLKLIAQASKEIPNSGGILGAILGENDASDFGMQLPLLGAGIAGFVTGLGTFGEEQKTSVKNGAEAIKELATAAEAIPNSGGWIGKIFGDNDIGDFGGKLGPLGEAIKEFADAVGNASEASVTNGVKCINALVRLSNIDFDTSIEGIADFGDLLPDLGSSVSSFASTLGKINTNTLETSIEKLKQVVQSINTLASEDISKINNLATSLKTLGQNGVQALSEAFSSGASKTTVASGVISLIESAVNQIKSEGNKSKFKSASEELVKSFGVGISENKESVNDEAKELATSSADAIKTQENYEKFKSAGKYLVEGFAAGISENTYLATAKAKEMAQAAERAAKKELNEKSPSKKFIEIGKFVAMGLANGIKKYTKKATSASTNMSKSVVDAANEEFEINSPSLVMDEMGHWVVKGLAEGIEKEMSAEEAAEKKAQNVIDAFQKYFDKNNILIDITDKELEIWKNGDGKYASKSEIDVKDLEYLNQKLAYQTANKSLAYDKWLQMSKTFGEDSQKAKDAWSEYYDRVKDTQNTENEIAEVGKKAYDREIELLKQAGDNRDAVTELWLKGSGKKASIDAQTNRLLRDNIEKINEANIGLMLANDEHERLIGIYAADSDEVKAAYDRAIEWENRLHDANAETYSILQNEISQKKDLIDKQSSLESKATELWVKSNKKANDNEIDARYISDSISEIERLQKQLKLDNDSYLLIVEEYGDQSAEALEALKKITDTELAIVDEEDKIANIQKDALERRINNADRAIEIRDKEHELWEEKYGEDASDTKKDRKNTERLKDNLEELRDNVNAERRLWRNAIAEFGEDSEEAEEAYSKYLDAKIKVAQTRNEIAQIAKDAEEREHENLKKQHELASSNVELLYNIWEKTEGRKATSIEKDLKKLGMLSEQLSAQAGILKLARDEWIDAKREYGSTANEAQEAYKNYLQEQLNLAELQNDIVDLNEKSVERQKLAQSKYKDYIEKYEKFYLMNGFTREDLERDANLVSGYDPNGTVGSLVEKTTEALNNLKSSKEYSNLISGFTSLGSEYVNAIDSGITSETSTLITSMIAMAEETISELKSSVKRWKDAGAYLGEAIADGIVKGIKDNAHKVIFATCDLGELAKVAFQAELGIYSPSRVFAGFGKYAVLGFANGLIDNANIASTAASELGKGAISSLQNTIKLISDAVESDIDTQPAIRPVLDLSSIEEGAARLNTMFTRAQAMSISASMNNKNADISQNGEGHVDNSKSFNFVQNNYSPKALSRSEIYRQTKNQFAAMKGALS